MLPALPPGRQQENELKEHVADLVAELGELRTMLRSINEPDLHGRLERLVAVGPHLAAAHGGTPGPDIADALSGLLTAARVLAVPARDPEFGEIPALEQVRKARRLIIGAADDALKSAEALGWHPTRDPFPHELAVPVARAEHATKLRAVEQRLDGVVQRLDALEEAKHQPTSFVQQTGLLNLYVGAMRVEVDLARLQLTVGEHTIDLGALARATEAMGELTGNFVATVQAWASRVSEAVARGAEAVRISVRRLATGVRTFARMILREARPPRPPPLAFPVPEMVLIPAGRFVMGVPEAESEQEKIDDGDARPLHTVTIAHPFRLGKYPVTRGEYAAFVEAAGYDKDGGQWRDPGFPQTDRDPVVNVSAEDAEAYAAWLNQMAGPGWRLPSEAEWEYAARAGTTTARYWGNSFRQAGRYAHAAGRGVRGTAPVGGKLPNAFGLHDMLGNVWEWTADSWHDSYDGAPEDGSVWTTGGSIARRVLRGGSWNGDPRDVRAGFRNHYEPGNRNDNVGFRLARTSF
ncbi:MAG TPA: formylglycine-generating enzyme family protein [Acetobacteraceae bacterium]|nr:formylglycine-generating enzyme family protein [Acetobacteraceae bacterium]